MEWISLSLLLLALTTPLSGMAVLPDHPLIFKQEPSNRYVPSNALEAEEESHTMAIAGEDSAVSFTEQCYEDQLKYDIIYRMDWKPSQPNEAFSMTTPADLVVVLDGGESCYTKADCMFAVQQQATPNLSDGCHLRENFYIGGDGNIYEGRGWKISPYWYLYGLRNQSLAVQFMGTYDSQLPSDDALRAFKSLLVTGVWLGTLSPRYKILSIRQLANADANVGESLHQNVQEWAGWVNDSVPMSRWEYQLPGFPNFVFRREWNATEPLREPEETRRPVSHVLLNNVGQRCNTRKECISRIQSLQQSHSKHYGDLLDNFYIGEDGNVYEGRGWDSLPQWHVEGMLRSYVSISFLGAFDSEIPTYRAIGSFKELIHTGVRLGKLSTKYKLTSLRVIYGNQIFLGDALHRYVRKWTPWAKSYDAMTSKERMEANLVPQLTRSGRAFDIRANSAFKKIAPSFPIEFIILEDGGEGCFHVKDCTDNMISEMNKYSGTYGDLLDNFYIGSDGIVYEGRGWENSSPLYLKHFRHSCITIKFFGTYNDSIPKNMTLQAFSSFIKLGIDAGKISPSYQIYSLRHIYNESTFLGDSFSEYAERLPQWSIEMAVDDDQERKSRGMLPLVSRDDWNADAFGDKFVEIKGYVHYVFVGGAGGGRCFSSSECSRRMVEQQKRGKDICDSLTDHFYIGDDGNFYEGLGWVEYSKDISSVSKERAISVKFIGRFRDDIPSHLAMSGFRRLLRYGINTGKLSEDFKVISYRQLCNCTEELGDAFQNEIESLKRFSNETISSNVSESLPYNPFQIVPSTNQKSHSISSRRSVSVPRPAEYIVISDGGERCYDREQCLNQVKTLPSTRDDYENFFVGEDGRSYQGSGWSTNIYGLYFTPESSMIFIGFLGKFNYGLPSSDALTALNYLIKSGIRWGKVHPDYKLVSIRQLCSNCSLVGDSLNIAIRTWSNWNEQINITADCTPFESKIVARQIWRQIYDHFPSYIYDWPEVFNDIEIENSNSDCKTEDECITWLRNHGDGDIDINFYIGGDGKVYEYLGWESLKYQTNFYGYEIIEPDLLKVKFIATFDWDGASSAMILAFRKLILKKGIENSWLDQSYTLRDSLSGRYSGEVFEMLNQN